MLNEKQSINPSAFRIPHSAFRMAPRVILQPSALSPQPSALSPRLSTFNFQLSRDVSPPRVSHLLCLREYRLTAQPCLVDDAEKRFARVGREFVTVLDRRRGDHEGSLR